MPVSCAAVARGLAIGCVAASLGAQVAVAEPTAPCEQAVLDVEVDGLLDDWEGARSARFGGTSSDASFDLYCRYDQTHLVLAVDVRDDRVVRVEKGNAREDSLSVGLGTGATLWTIAALPGAATAKPRRTVGAGGAVPPWVEVEDSLRPKGFALELRFPLAKLAGFSAGASQIVARIAFSDSDRASGGDVTTVAFSGALALSGKRDLLSDFLKAVGATAKDVVLDVQADVDAQRPGRERVVVAGTAIGVLAERFRYVSLPIAGPSDRGRVELFDLGGARVLAAVVRQRGSGGLRELLLLYSIVGGQWSQLAAVEVAKEQGGQKLRSQWRVQTVGKKRELWITAGPATGWDEETYAESPATDAHPIHLPWDEDRWGSAFALVNRTLVPRPLPMPKRK